MDVNPDQRSISASIVYAQDHDVHQLISVPSYVKEQEVLNEEYG